MQEDEIKVFLDSGDFIEMMHDVRKDDIEQFQGEWSYKPLSEAMIFSELDKCIQGIGSHYQTKFRDLVYGNEIPTVEEIKIILQKIKEYI